MTIQQIEDVCYSAEDFIEELEKGVEFKESYQVGFSKWVPHRNTPPFIQAPPMRYNLDYPLD